MASGLPPIGPSDGGWRGVDSCGRRSTQIVELDAIEAEWFPVRRGWNSNFEIMSLSAWPS